MAISLLPGLYQKAGYSAIKSLRLTLDKNVSTRRRGVRSGTRPQVSTVYKSDRRLPAGAFEVLGGNEAVIRS